MGQDEIRVRIEIIDSLPKKMPSATEYSSMMLILPYLFSLLCHGEQVSGAFFP